MTYSLDYLLGSRLLPKESSSYYSVINHTRLLLARVERYLKIVTHRLKSYEPIMCPVETYIGLRSLFNTLGTITRLPKRFSGAINRSNYIKRKILKEMRFIQKAHAFDPSTLLEL